MIRTWAGQESGPVVLPSGGADNQVGQLLEKHFVEAALVGVIPDELKDEPFGERVRQSKERTTFLLMELERLLPSITYPGCQPVVLKGAGLAQTLYAEPEQRWFIDLDILVPRQEVDEVCNRLQDIGYQPHTGSRDAEYYEKYHLHRMMVGPQGSCVEIHWDLTLPNSVYGFDVVGVFSRAREMSLGGVTTLTASPVDQIFHGVYQNIADGYLDLRRVLDFVLLMKNMETADWLYLIKEANRTGMGQALALSLNIVKEIAGVEPPAQFRDEFHLGKFNARIFKGLNVLEGCLDRKGELIAGYAIMLHLLLTPSLWARFRESFLFLLPTEEALMNSGHQGQALPGFFGRIHFFLYHGKALTMATGRMALAFVKG